VDEAARALGVEPHSIVKSLVFRSADGITVLAVIRGDQRVDVQRLAQASGVSSLKLVPATDVEALTGYPAGATPPIGHRTPLPVYVDPAVLEEAVVFGGGGDEQAMLEISSEELVRLARATVALISQAS
jgi:Cys-tRNA(Pro) deacylase